MDKSTTATRDNIMENMDGRINRTKLADILKRDHYGVIGIVYTKEEYAPIHQMNENDSLNKWNEDGKPHNWVIEKRWVDEGFVFQALADAVYGDIMITCVPICHEGSPDKTWANRGVSTVHLKNYVVLCNNYYNIIDGTDLVVTKMI